MTIDVGHSIAIIAVVSITTIILRSVPFIIFGRKEVSTFTLYLGKALPPAIIATLVIYCIRNVDFTNLRSGIPELISVLVVALLHIWKRNTLLSIGVGTICYMALIRLIV